MMQTETDLIVGNWYQHLDKGQEFQVIDVDEGNGIVETQHFDGDIEEIALDEWYEMAIEPIEAPEDWTGPVDDIEPDELGYSETAMAPADWSAPLEELKVEGSSEDDDTLATAEDRSEDTPEQGIELIPYLEQ